MKWHARQQRGEALRHRTAHHSCMHPFRRLSVWRKAHELTLRVYETTSKVSARRYSGLTSELRRSASSIAANIVEGAARGTPAQFATCLDLALASARELDYHVLLASDLKAIDSSEHVRLTARIDEVSRMLVGLRKRLRKPPSRSLVASKSERVR
jgi:four helix bundle protein